MDSGGTPLLTTILDAIANAWAFAWTGLWMGALAATLLATLVAVAVRARVMRPATRHALWLAVLISFLTPSLLAGVWRPDWFATPVVATEPREPALETDDLGPAPVLRDTTRLHTPPAESKLAITNESAPITRSERTPSEPASCEVSEAFAPVAAATVSVERDSSTPSSKEKTLVSEPPATTQFDLAATIARLAALRDAIANLPPLPWFIWLPGTLVVLAVMALRIRSVRRTIGNASPAPAACQCEVDAVARSIGLDGAPTTLVSDESISPFVWSGAPWGGRGQTLLVLPADLWISLDRRARRTVLIHELAHVRRGDHRLVWLEMLVTSIYWWHPLAWWVRARFRDAAESACDTWVTSVCPDERRSYAEALVLASSILSSPTDQSGRGRPHAFIAGHLTDEAVRVGFVTGRSSRLARRISMIMTSRSAPRMSLVGATACLVAIGLGGFVAPGIACPPSCGEEKEARPARVRAIAPNSTYRTAPQNPAFFGEAPAIDAMGGVETTAPAASQPLLQPLSGFGINTEQAELVRREYRLPDGMREALMAFMLRDDVPLYVGEGRDSIVVDATPAQHEVFAAFVRMIHPTDNTASQGAINTRSAARGFARGGAQNQQAIAAEAMRRDLAQLRMQREMLTREAELLREKAEETERRAEELRESTAGLEEQRNALSRLNDQTANRALTEALRTIEQRAKATENEARAIERQADSSDARMEQMEEAIERLEERLEELAENLPWMSGKADVEANFDSEVEFEPAEIETKSDIRYEPAAPSALAPRLAPNSIAETRPVAPTAPIPPIAPAPPASPGPASKPGPATVPGPATLPAPAPIPAIPAGPSSGR
jgi:beta-lactamase regulating signal transducer with metallopeptidase domain